MTHYSQTRHIYLPTKETCSFLAAILNLLLVFMRGLKNLIMLSDSKIMCTYSFPLESDDTYQFSDAFMWRIIMYLFCCMIYDSFCSFDVRFLCYHPQQWLLEGNVFTSACHSFCRGGVGFPVCITGHMTRGSTSGRSASRRGICIRGGGSVSKGSGRPPWDTTGYSQWAGSTHPTGMHPCSFENSLQKNWTLYNKGKFILRLWIGGYFITYSEMGYRHIAVVIPVYDIHRCRRLMPL